MFGSNAIIFAWSLRNNDDLCPYIQVLPLHMGAWISNWFIRIKMRCCWKILITFRITWRFLWEAGAAASCRENLISFICELSGVLMADIRANAFVGACSRAISRRLFKRMKMKRNQIQIKFINSYTVKSCMQCGHGSRSIFYVARIFQRTYGPPANGPSSCRWCSCCCGSFFFVVIVTVKKALGCLLDLY